MLRSLCFLALAATALGAPVAAADFFPLTEHVVRTYHSTSTQWDDQYTTEFVGTEVVNGITTQVRRFTGGQDDGLQHFWTETPEGDKLLHGWNLPGLRSEFVPPILEIDAPLFVGKTWVVNTVSTLFGPVTFHFNVVSFGPVTVPAGTYDAFTVESSVDFPPLQKAVGFDVTGQRLLRAEAAQVLRDFYADGIGQLGWQEGSRVDELVSIDVPVAVEPTTWTSVRALYR